MITDYQALYLTNYIKLKKSGDVLTRIGMSLMESKITLNPHQINAALKFFKNPLCKGIILADEVGLGKTIEAGLIISQYWYERKRKVLVITPSSLMKQWNEELFNKFHIKSILLDSKSIKRNDFQWEEKIYITSINSVYLNKEIFNYEFDLIVIDEAHKLRNVYKNKGIMSTAIKDIFFNKKKLLLTANPFQNNLLELYGLVSILDEQIFGDIYLFKDKYIKNYEDNKGELKKTLENYISRTLRKDVKKYINYTKRHVQVYKYKNTEKEILLYEMVSNLLYSHDFLESYSLGQNQLIIILLQKLLSSSIYAVKSTLNNIIINIKNPKITYNNNELDIEDDIEDDIQEAAIKQAFKEGARVELVKNIERCIKYANEIKSDSKYNTLSRALKKALELIEKDKNRNRKILIFTESRKTQEYLFNKLKNDGFKNILSFNGDNSSIDTNKIYMNWLNKNRIRKEYTNKSINVRRAIIDAFENDYEIMIATDAAAEGLNMQFCSIVINYDLPWNPQRIEQRIGRCHRYGQKNDVIVMNILNISNSIDERIYELLSSKLGIFDETFGASDEILGKTNIAEDLEQSIKNIYKLCRSPIEIEKSFNELQKKYKIEIDNSLKDAEYKLVKYFDEELKQTFDFQFIEAKKIINEFEEIFWELIKFKYPEGIYDDKEYVFKLPNMQNALTISKQEKNKQYEYFSINSKFGKYVMEIDENINKFGSIKLNYTNSDIKVGYLDDTLEKQGKILVTKIYYDSFEITEDLVITGYFVDGSKIPREICHKIFKLNGTICDDINININEIKISHNEEIKHAIKEIENINNNIFNVEANYINNWADNKLEEIQLNVRDMRNKRRDMQIDFDNANDLKTKENLQEEISKISKKISKVWKELADAEDDIDNRRRILISNLNKEKNKQVIIDKLLEVDFIII